jgi:MFS family permease
MIPFVLWRLPESMDFLLAKRPANALRRLNDLLLRMQREPVRELPEAPPVEEKHRKGNPVAHLLIGGLARSTLLIWSSFFLLMFAFYFVLSWTPKLLVQAGLSSQQGITGGVLMNLGGIIGGTLFGLLSTKLKLRNLTAAYLILTAVGLALFGMYATNLTMAFAIALFIGFFIFGSMAGLYALAPILYPAVIRTTGMGWSIGIGRIGAIIAPTFVGFLLDSGWQAADLYYAFTIPLILAMLTVRGLRLK